ncbi:esterase 6-like [Zophobas morio]|uniref:esterase 6-like n=1 Tax=Zophobas morio TaxID=2755281 RepID=UPI0030828119
MTNYHNLYIFLSLLALGESVIVELPHGKIQGKQSLTFNNKTFYSFVKVPYASPPVGELRFKAPVPPKAWEGILDATSNRVVCHQIDQDLPLESEDCLYLNIYTPQRIRQRYFHFRIMKTMRIAV